MYILVKIPDTKDRNSADTVNTVSALMQVMLEYGFSKLVDKGFELKIDNDRQRKKQEYLQKRYEKEAETKAKEK